MNVMPGFKRGKGKPYHPRPSSRLRPFESLYNAFISYNAHKKFPVEISYEEFLEFTLIPNCSYCDEPVQWTPYYTQKFGAACNLDRMDASKGHVKDNLTVCCTRCNRTKLHYYSAEEFRVMMQALKAFRAKQNFLSLSQGA